MSETQLNVPTVEVFDILENKIKDIGVERRRSRVFTIEFNGKSRGFYYVRIEYDNHFVTKRITVVNQKFVRYRFIVMPVFLY